MLRKHRSGQGMVVTLITVESVSKRYGSQQVLQDVSFSVEAGQVAAIVGKNGCGKSTLLSIVAGMLLPDTGRVTVGPGGGGPVPVGYVAQGDCLFEELTVRDNLAFWASANRLPPGEVGQSPYVAMLGLDSFLEKRVSRLSGGMRRRTAICTALLGDPPCLLLDEPFTGLDLIYRQELSAFLVGLRQEGKTLLYTTHSPEELATLGDFALLLSQGKILERLNSADFGSEYDLQTHLITLLKGENHHERG